MTVHTALPSGEVAPLVRQATGLAGILMLVCGWSATALAATGPNNNCQEISKNLRSLETPVVELSITLVDLPGTDVEMGMINVREPIGSSGTASDSTAPLLFLTPRVVSMLREIFDDVSDAETRDGPIGAPAIVSPRRESTLPPIAEGNTDQSLLPSLEEAAVPTPIQAIPRFQRPMYRTDI